MNGKLNKNIGFSLLPFAFLFLFEPGYTLIDFLPDFLGYSILCLAIINLADISPRIMEAYEGFKRGILINVLRCIAVYLLNRHFADISRSLGLLIFCFIFSIFELLSVLPAYKNLFEGLLHLGMMHDGSAVYLKKLRKKTVYNKADGTKTTYIKESSRNVTEKLYFLTLAFIIIKHCATCLPEFTTLISNTEYEFIMILRIFGAVLVLPLSIVWLVRFLVYCSKIRKDRLFIENLSKLYLTKVRDNPNYYTVRMINIGTYVMLTSCALSVDFYSKYINVLPDYILFVLIISATLILRNYSKKWLPLFLISLSGTAVSIVSHLLSIEFHSKFYPNAIRKNLNAYYSYYKMLGFHIVESVLFFVTVIFVILLLWDIYKIHSDMALSTSRAEIKEFSTKYKAGALAVIFTAALSAIGSVYYVAAQPFYNTDKWYFYYSAVIAVAVSVIFAFASAYFIGFINNSIKFRYRLDI